MKSNKNNHLISSFEKSRSASGKFFNFCKDISHHHARFSVLLLMFLLSSITTDAQTSIHAKIHLDTLMNIEDAFNRERDKFRELYGTDYDVDSFTVTGYHQKDTPWNIDFPWSYGNKIIKYTNLRDSDCALYFGRSTRTDFYYKGDLYVSWGEIKADNYDFTGYKHLFEIKKLILPSIPTSAINLAQVWIDTLEIPESRDTIRSYSFVGCRFRNTLKITSSIKHIEEYAFFRCMIDTLEICSSDIDMSIMAFRGTKIKKLILPEDFPSLKVVSDIDNYHSFKRREYVMQGDFKKCITFNEDGTWNFYDDDIYEYDENSTGHSTICPLLWEDTLSNNPKFKLHMHDYGLVTNTIRQTFVNLDLYCRPENNYPHNRSPRNFSFVEKDSANAITFYPEDTITYIYTPQQEELHEDWQTTNNSLKVINPIGLINTIGTFFPYAMEIQFKGDNKNFLWKDGVLFDRTGKYLLYIPPSKKGYTIEEGVTVWPPYISAADARCYIDTLILPKNLEVAPSGPFGCSYYEHGMSTTGIVWYHVRYDNPYAPEPGTHRITDRCVHPVTRHMTLKYLEVPQETTTINFKGLRDLWIKEARFLCPSPPISTYTPNPPTNPNYTNQLFADTYFYGSFFNQDQYKNGLNISAPGFEGFLYIENIIVPYGTYDIYKKWLDSLKEDWSFIYKKATIKRFSYKNIIEDDATGWDETLAKNVQVSIENRNICIMNAEDKTIKIYSPTGSLLYNNICHTSPMHIPMTLGIYIVMCGEQSFKILLN